MSNHEHKYQQFGCTIEADLENTVAVLTDPDGIEFNFVADDPKKPVPEGAKKHTAETCPKNALWHALQHAKADEKKRAEADKLKPVAQDSDGAFKPVDQIEVDEPTDIDTTDVEHVEGVEKL
jgi:hypothetical protein